MGLFDKIRGEFIDIIEWIDDDRNTLVWRFPRYHDQIKNGAQLIVRPGQRALFLHQGEIADVFGPGRHVLQTENLPVLSTLQGWKYGFDSPFKAQIYFVSTRQITELRWGTPNPMLMRDRDFGPVRVRAFGTYALKGADPEVLLRELVGTDSRFEAGEIEELMRSLIANAFAEWIGSCEIPILDLARSYPKISEDLCKRVAGMVDDEYGLEVTQVRVLNISLPEEVEEAVDARSSIGIVGDMGTFQAYQMGRALAASGDNPGGAAGEGIGLGLGVALAGQVMQGRGGSTVTMPPPIAQWHVAEGGSAQGPYDFEKLRAMVAEGRLKPETSVWSGGMTDWLPARQVSQLAALFEVPPPPPPPPVS